MGPRAFRGERCVSGKGQSLVPGFWVVLGSLSSGSSAPALRPCVYISNRGSPLCQQGPCVSFVTPAPWAQPGSPSPPRFQVHAHGSANSRLLGGVEGPGAVSPVYPALPWAVGREPWAPLPLGSCLPHAGHMRALSDTGFSRRL